MVMRGSYSFLLIASSLAATAAFAQKRFQPSEEYQQKFVIYQDCQISKARKIEQSDAEIDEIVAASRTFCARKRSDLRITLMADQIYYENQTGDKLPPNIIDRLMGRADQIIAEKARLRILEDRTARKRRR